MALQKAQPTGLTITFNTRSYGTDESFNQPRQQKLPGLLAQAAQKAAMLAAAMQVSLGPLQTVVESSSNFSLQATLGISATFATQEVKCRGRDHAARNSTDR